MARPVNAPQDRNKWWLNQYTLNQIETIEASQAVEKAQLAQQQEQFNQVLNMYKDAFGNIGTNQVTVPEQFNQNVDLFAKGGEFGTGLKAETERSAQEALAAGQIGLAQSGMSSGTNVAGLQARVLADKGLANAKIEDQRIANLSGALTTAGSANLSAQQLAQQKDLALLNTLSSFRV